MIQTHSKIKVQLKYFLGAQFYKYINIQEHKIFDQIYENSDITNINLKNIHAEQVTKIMNKYKNKIKKE